MPRFGIHPPRREAKARAAPRRQGSGREHRLGATVDARDDVRNGEEAVRLGHLSPPVLRPRHKWQILISSRPHPEIHRILRWQGTLTSKVGRESDALARAIGAVVEGLTFYDLANAAVAEMRVKVAFEEMGRRKKAQLAKLEAGAGTDATPAPGITRTYPPHPVAKAECYVCGFVAETKAMPSGGPRCGAGPHALEKEIA